MLVTYVLQFIFAVIAVQLFKVSQSVAALCRPPLTILSLICARTSLLGIEIRVRVSACLCLCPPARSVGCCSIIGANELASARHHQRFSCSVGGSEAHPPDRIIAFTCFSVFPAPLFVLCIRSFQLKS